MEDQGLLGQGLVHLLAHTPSPLQEGSRWAKRLPSQSIGSEVSRPAHFGTLRVSFPSWTSLASDLKEGTLIWQPCVPPAVCVSVVLTEVMVGHSRGRILCLIKEDLPET
jgi:hypothetical protein